MKVAERLERKAAEYRARAMASAVAAADASSLTAVRAGHTRAEQRWLKLAEAEDERLRAYHL